MSGDAYLAITMRGFYLHARGVTVDTPANAQPAFFLYVYLLAQA
jgi:hypothetical protein